MNKTQIRKQLDKMPVEDLVENLVYLINKDMLHSEQLDFFRIKEGQQ